MSDQVFLPSARIQSLLAPVVPHVLQRSGKRGLVALTVLGSAARGEETWQGDRLAGDVDLAAIVLSPDPLTTGRIMRGAEGLPPGIELHCLPLYSLSRYRTLFLYEARHAGWVLWGPQDVFRRVRMDGPADIPLWEGVRLLLNRVLDCLRAAAGLMPAGYAAVKSYLALGEADLIARGCYAPSYRARMERLEAHGNVLGSREWLDRVRWAHHVKLHGDALRDAPGGQEHQASLLAGLECLLALYIGRPVTITEGLRIVGRRYRNPAHSAVYLLRHMREPGLRARALHGDPIFAIWELAVRALRGEVRLGRDALCALLADFDQTLQPLPSGHGPASPGAGEGRRLQALWRSSSTEHAHYLRR